MATSIDFRDVSIHYLYPDVMIFGGSITKLPPSVLTRSPKRAVVFHDQAVINSGGHGRNTFREKLLRVVKCVLVSITVSELAVITKTDGPKRSVRAGP